MSENETKTLRQQLPYLPEALREQALDRLGRYLIYYSISRNEREAVCTKCGRVMVAEKGDTGRFGALWKAKHREEGRCPCCEEKVTYIAQGRMKNFSSLRKVDRFVFVWAESHDRIWMVAAHAWDEIDPQEYHSDLHYAPDRIWLLTPGKVQCERVVYDCWPIGTVSDHTRQAGDGRIPVIRTVSRINRLCTTAVTIIGSMGAKMRSRSFPTRSCVTLKAQCGSTAETLT